MCFQRFSYGQGQPYADAFLLQTRPDDPLAVRHGVDHGYGLTVLKDYVVILAGADSQNGHGLLIHNPDTSWRRSALMVPRSLRLF